MTPAVQIVLITCITLVLICFMAFRAQGREGTRNGNKNGRGQDKPE